MGRVSYEELNQNSQQHQNRPYYWYFKLAKDGDSAIVRIMHDSTKDLEILRTHAVQIKGKYRTLSCLRTPKEDIALCPLCSADAALKTEVYVHLIEYSTAADGSIIPEPKVWARPYGFIDELKPYFEDYAPFSDTVVKITRTGVGPGTRYSIMPLNPMKYTADAYPKDESLFAEYTALGVNVQERDAESVMKLMSSGDLTFATKVQPQKEQEVVSDAPKAEIEYAAPVQPEVKLAVVDTPVAPVVPPVIQPQPEPVKPVEAQPAQSPWQPAPRRAPSVTPFNQGSETGFRPTRNL